MRKLSTPKLLWTSLCLLRVDIKNRWKKIPFYLSYVWHCAYPSRLARWNIAHDENALRKKYGANYLRERVDYCNKLNRPFTVQNKKSVGEDPFRGFSAYVIDIKRALNGFERKVKLDYRFGDVTQIPDFPTIVKSRPIAGVNQNSVLLKLNSARHFNFVHDPLRFEDKKDGLVWRGANNSPMRKLLLQVFAEHPHNSRFDIAGVNLKGVLRYTRRSYMQISSQLKYKFILSVRGHDVATNTKWIMSSNSLCVMPQPKFETWFMEGRLLPHVHYVQVADDFSDLEEKCDYYLKHQDQATRIIRNANEYVAQFLDAKLERYIAHQVLEKYFHLAGQGAQKTKLNLVKASLGSSDMPH